MAYDFDLSAKSVLRTLGRTYWRMNGNKSHNLVPVSVWRLVETLPYVLYNNIIIILFCFKSNYMQIKAHISYIQRKTLITKYFCTLNIWLIYAFKIFKPINFISTCKVNNMQSLKIKIIQPWRQLAIKSKKACFARERLREIIFNKNTNISGCFRSHVKKKTQHINLFTTFFRI